MLEGASLGLGQPQFRDGERYRTGDIRLARRVRLDVVNKENLVKQFGVKFVDLAILSRGLGSKSERHSTTPQVNGFR